MSAPGVGPTAPAGAPDGRRTAASVAPMAGPSSAADVKARLAAEVDRRRELLVHVSHQIHARPELCYEERFAHDLLTSVLEGEGLAVTRSPPSWEGGSWWWGRRPKRVEAVRSA